MKRKVMDLIAVLAVLFLLSGLVSMAIPAMADTLPAVIGTTPADTATGVAANSVITAVFNEAVDPSTVTAVTFILMQGVNPVTGVVTYTGTTATFTPASDLARDTIYTATITTGVKDLAGNALANNYTWNFQTTTTVAYYTINEDPSPVFSTLVPDQEYVIKDNVNYKLYYAGDDFTSINLAQSSDGINWTPYSGNPIITDGQYHADVKYYSTGFPGANSGTNPSAMTMNYRMWYQGLNENSINGWIYAESPDGINWYNHIPVTQFGPQVYSALTGVTYGIADVIYTPRASNTGTDWTFRIYANVQWEGGAYGGKELVVMAFSSNGYNWTGYDPTSVGYATPVFAGTLDGTSFDTDHIGWFKVIENSPTDWQAFYSGGKGTTYQALNGIGYATSTDGINWTRRQTLFTTADGVAWRSQSVWMPSVVKIGNGYAIYFLGSDNPDITDSDWIQFKVGRAILNLDTIAPTVTVTTPTNDINGVPFNSTITATFSKALDPSTVTGATFTLTHGATSVTGTVTYAGVTATFTPTVSLTPNTIYTATITTGVKDPAGNALATNYSWSFISAQSYTAFNDQCIVYTAPSGDAKYPSVIYNSNNFGLDSALPTYKMWYSDGTNIYLITSSDGIHWSNTPTQCTGLGAVASHAQVLYDSNHFGLGPSGPLYQIWYWTGNMDYSISDISTAQSTDGINWTNSVTITQDDPSNQLVVGDSVIAWNNGTYGPVCLFYQQGASNKGVNPWGYSYVMYYDGTDGSMEETGLAYSTDGLSWTAYTGNPVLAVTPTAWDSNDAVYGTVYHDTNGFHYWYSGGVASPYDGIGLASSSDGNTWTKNPDTILDINDGDAYRDSRCCTPSVINDGTDSLKMYYQAQTTGGSIDIGLAILAYVTAPTATTNAASGITTAGATLNGTVNPKNGDTIVNFEYGTNSSYGTTVNAVQSLVSAGAGVIPVSTAVTGLTPGTLYHFRVVATDSGGATYGGDQTFIMKIALTITANSSSKPDGSTMTFAGTEFTTSGLVNSDTVTSVTLTSAGASSTATPGIYDIVPSAAIGSGLGNYSITYDTGSLTVNPVITVTSSGAGGTISPSGNVAVTYNTNQTFTITPYSVYRVSSVIVDGNQQGAITSYTFTNVTTDHIIAVEFAFIPVITPTETITTTSTTTTPTPTSTTTTETTTTPTSTQTPTPIILSQQVTTGNNLVTQSDVILDSQGVSETAGQIATADGNVSFNIAAGTKMLNAQGQPINEVTASMPATVPPPPPQDAAVQPYDFGPAGATFVPPLTLTLNYDPSNFPVGSDQSKIYIAWWDSATEQWINLPSIVDQVHHTVTAQVPHFTLFSVLVPLQPAAFSVSNLSITPVEIEIGKSVTISTMLANTGDLSGSYDVNLMINDKVVATKTITLTGNGSQEVDFTVSESTTGTYSVAIGDQTGSFVVTAAPIITSTTTLTTTRVNRISGWLVPVIAFVVIIVVGIFILAMATRRKSRNR